jgi:hypothetical protein
MEPVMHPSTSLATEQPFEDPLLRRAQRRVRRKIGFMIHLMVFVCVNLGLFVIDQASGGHAWSRWPLAGWGIGLAIHALVTFVGLQGDGLRERMLQSELEHLRGRS